MLKVAQCWDDGVCTDIRLTGMLRQYHAKATFNLCPGRFPEHTTPSRWVGPEFRDWSFTGFLPGTVGRDIWKEVYDGFQVASHCWKHETAGCVSDAEFLEGAIRAKKFLEDELGRECPGIVWPCGRTTPGALEGLRSAGFRYGRLVDQAGESPATAADPLLIRPTCSFTAGNFWDLYERAKKESGVFYFWGHSYNTYDYEPLWQQLEYKIRTISEDPEAEWVDVVELVKYVKCGK